MPCLSPHGEVPWFCPIVALVCGERRWGVDEMHGRTAVVRTPQVGFSVIEVEFRIHATITLDWHIGSLFPRLMFLLGLLAHSYFQLQT